MIRHLAAGVLLAALTPSLLAAQGGWALDLSAGRALYDPVAAQITANNVMLGVRYDGNRPLWFYLSGGVPLGSEDPRWGAGGIGGRIGLDREPFWVGMELGSHLYGYGYMAADTATWDLGGGATLELLPSIFVQQGILGLAAHSGLLQHTAALSDTTLTNRVHDSAVQVLLTPRPALTVMAEGRYVRAAEGNYPYAGGTAQLLQEWGSVWVLGGRWLSEDIPTPVYGMGGSVRLGSRFELHASWQQEARDPLYWNSPRQTWMVRLSHHLGRSRARLAPILPQTQDGRVLIRIPLDASETTPYILGDFTSWEPVPMVRSGPYWTVTLPVAPGVYRYGFRSENGTWFVPSSVPGQVDDGMGGSSAVLIVP